VPIVGLLISFGGTALRAAVREPGLIGF